MKKRLLLFVFMIISILLISNDLGVKANAPYYTVTVGPKGYLVPTQTAYNPVGILNHNVTLNGPEDLYIKNNIFYIADSKNKRIVVLDEDGNLLKLIGETILTNPTGVFVNDKNEIFVADKENKVVFKFSEEGNLLYTYDRPTEPIFGKESPYVPTKVVVDRRGNLYIIGEGSTSGIIQLNYAGEFLGYFGVNNTSLSWKDKLADFVLGDKNDFFKFPPSSANLSIDSQNLVYSVTHNVFDPIKKLNIQGLNVLNTGGYYPTEKIMDISIGKNGDIYVITENSLIFEYDNVGNLLFVFGGEDNGNHTLGLTDNPSGISTDDYGNLYVLDRTYNNIQMYQKTEFVNLVHQGIELYLDGKYIESTSIWNKVVQMNSSFALAHKALGKSYYKQKQYHKAMNEFKIANDKSGYSDAYWKIRHSWLKSNLGYIIIGLFLFYIIINIIKVIDKRSNFLYIWKDIIAKIKNIKIVSELLLLFRMIKHPLDTFYDIKHQHKASYSSASIWLFILFIEYLIYIYFTGFIFNNANTQNLVLIVEVGKIVGIFVLWAFSNYLVSTLSDGEGWFKDIYIATVYAFAPLILGLLPLTIVSHFLTFNELFLYQFVFNLLIYWSLILLFLMVKEIHNYSVFETIKNILITIFGMIIISLIAFIIYMLINQLFDFILSIIKEVVARAKFS